jgi:hypothetical protein
MNLKSEYLFIKKNEYLFINVVEGSNVLGIVHVLIVGTT